MCCATPVFNPLRVEAGACVAVASPPCVELLYTPVTCGLHAARLALPPTCSSGPCCGACLACLVQVALLDEMRENGINPDQYSYNSAIYGCVKAQQSQQMTMVLARMR